MKKILTASLLFMLSHIILYAQSTKQNDAKAKHDSASNAELSKEIKNADFIFEGTVIEAKSFVKGAAYTEEVIQIHKIFKGNLDCGTVKMIIPGGEIKVNDSVSMSDNDEYRPGTERDKGVSGMFLCNINQLPNPSISFKKATNMIVLQWYRTIYYGDNYRENKGSFQNTYKRFLKENGLKIEKCDSVDFQRQFDSLAKIHHYKSKPFKKNAADIQSPVPTKADPNTKGPNNQDDEFQYPSSRRTERGPNNEGNDAFFLPEPEFLPEPPPAPVPMSFSSDGLLYWLNITSVDSTNKAVNFDIEVENEDSDDTFYLASANIYLHLNDSSLAGAHLSVSWVLGADYNQYGVTTSSPDYHLYATDTAIGSMVSLSASSYTTLCHAHLSLPCGVLPNIYLDQTLMNEATNVEWHTTATHRVHTGDTTEIDTIVGSDSTVIDTNTVPLYTDETFDTTYLTNPDIDTVGSSNLMPCNPYITSFTPTVIAAGVNDTMKIYGYNFGNKI